MIAKSSVIDCTLRDGLYVIDHQLELEKFSFVLKQLDNVGIDYIEIGHGLGVGGNRFGRSGPFTDNELFSLPQKILTKAKWGTFCIAKLNDDDLAIIEKFNPDFLKIGVLPNRLEALNERFEKILRSGSIIFLFLMQTDKWHAEEIRAAVNLCEKFNLAGIYCVDSTGCMLPEDVKSFLIQSENIVRE